MPAEDWVERQIRAAQERGDFHNLPGAGKPIPKRPGGTREWVARKLREENADVTALLPPSLALPKEVADLPVRLAEERSEATVRELVKDLNARIAKAHRDPQVGPPLRIRPARRGGDSRGLARGPLAHAGWFGKDEPVRKCRSLALGSPWFQHYRGAPTILLVSAMR
jgi:hypothetical protein